MTTALEKKGLVAAAREQKKRGSKAIQKYLPMEPALNAVLVHWYDLAIADLSLCRDFDPSPAVIAERLEIRESEVLQALERLLKAGILKQVDGTYVKSRARIRFPASVSREVIRGFHRQMIRKAEEQMARLEQEDYDRRMITGITFSMNPERVQWARERLQEVLHEIAEKATEGETTEVYQLNLQLFPLSKSSSKR